MVIVTDIDRVYKVPNGEGKHTKGYYMDGFLETNLEPITRYLKDDWDVVGIVSGRGKVRTGKSCIASQIGYYIAWMIAGGKMTFIRDKKGKLLAHKYKKPTKPVRFNLKENYVFSAEDLKEQAESLFKKYGKNQVIVYDEGRQGLDSSRAMENVNKGMVDFFQECGQYNHVILIVLPNFFKLHEDYAVARSLFLVDVYVDENMRRGYFNFYNEIQKEKLYYFGKRMIGILSKYMSATPSFYGRFLDFYPFDKEEYNKIKQEALNKKKEARQGMQVKLQRNIIIWYLVKKCGIKPEDIQEVLKTQGNIDLGIRYIQNIVASVINMQIAGIVA
jgi:hypothetical protein